MSLEAAVREARILASLFKRKCICGHSAASHILGTGQCYASNGGNGCNCQHFKQA